MKGNDSRLGGRKKSTSVVFRIIDLFFKNIFVLIFRERGRAREREIGAPVGERHQLAASCMPHTGDLAPSLGMCPDE